MPAAAAPEEFQDRRRLESAGQVRRHRSPREKKEATAMATSGQWTENGGFRREWLSLGRLLLESVATGAFVSLVLGLAVFIVATQAQAAASQQSDIQQGTLFLRDSGS